MKFQQIRLTHPFFTLAQTKLLLWVFSQLLTFLLFSSCSSNNNDEEGYNDNGVEQEVVNLFWRQGNVAIGIAAAFSEVCLISIDSLCTRANYLGNYQLTELTDEQGFLSADFVSANGDNRRMYSLYFPDAEINPSNISNINPTTDVIVASWLAANLETTAALCFIDPDCINQANRLVTAEDIRKIEDALEQLLQPFWPANEPSSLTDFYIADPTQNAIDAMHDFIHYQIDEQQNLQVLNHLQEPIAEVALTQLALGDTASFITEADVVSLDEFERALTLAPPALEQNSDIRISIDIQPGRYGQAPFFVIITTSATAPHVDSSMQIDNYLIWPNGDVEQWQEAEQQVELTMGGRYDVLVHAIDSEGHEMIRSQSIELQRDEQLQATYGSNGSCQQQQLTSNDYNLCLEMIDGGTINQCDENETLTYLSSGCSLTAQNQGDYLGQCELLQTQVLVYYYQNPLRFNNETIEQQQARLAILCDYQGGSWQ